MNKIDTKKIFWKVVNAIGDVSDTVTENDKNGVIESGMQLSNGCSVMFGLEDGVLRFYNKDNLSLIEFTEESEGLLLIKELFENLEL